MFDGPNGAIVVQERYTNGSGVSLQFGPLIATLTDLFEQGYWLECHIPKINVGINTRRRNPIWLRDVVTRYTVGKVSWHQLQTAKQDDTVMLSKYVSKTVQQSDVGTPMFPPTPEPAAPPMPEPDPFKTLLDRYPRKPKTIMMGNRTLREYLVDVLDGV